ncbi:MAG: pyruvate kinase [Flavobacteriales bacterium]|jgi:pyruvate kinase|nr:pyruvate kinase [Flavobacteriales bacterium]MDP4716499.1 pyruvate kinase [Flavobacteriales bacterium]MDP4730617.1 pyruvate kinase [Flavobacteriales bacterium]MDP4819139.1 pyruvate kinase [Flavobacteriales bacterium]MDP4950518.1 pyruvate kinase [Flavobacteriales bacterium]
MKKTKIVATIGPVSANKEVLKGMIQAGLNVVRLNFSHGSHDDHSSVVDFVREIDKELGTNTALLADLQGPKLRVGVMQDNGVMLEAGKQIIITTEEQIGTATHIYTNYKEFPSDVKPGERVLLDDGKIAIRILSTDGKKEVLCEIIQGGILSSKKGLNLPETKVSLPSLSKKDLNDLEFALSMNIDWIGLSFVRTAEDVRVLKGIIAENGKHAKVVAKIEKPEALEVIDDIIRETDAVMVARGDLGVEIPIEQVPLAQKMIVKKCVEAAKPVIVATQMMESMITSMTPTRAEVTDVANAVLDGADAVMLSGETSVGAYPVAAIAMMSSIITEAEKFPGLYYLEEAPYEMDETRFITDSICFSACRVAKRTGATSIATMSFSGYTGYKISSWRPNAHVFVFTGNKRILTQLNLVWGVKAFYYDKMVSTDQTIADIRYILKKNGYVKDGDFLVNVASMPIAEQGTTNMLKISRI